MKTMAGIHVIRVVMGPGEGGLLAFAELLQPICPHRARLYDAVHAGILRESLPWEAFCKVASEIPGCGELTADRHGADVVWCIRSRIRHDGFTIHIAFKQLMNGDVEIELAGKTPANTFAQYAGIFGRERLWSLHSLLRPRSDIQEPDLFLLQDGLTVTALAELELRPAAH